MQLLLNAVGSNVPEAHLGKGLYMPSLKAFMDDTTLVMNRRPVVQNTLDTFNSLLGWCRMAFKPAKSRSLALVERKICSDVSFVVAGQRVPTVSEELLVFIGEGIIKNTTQTFNRSDTVRQAVEGLQVIGEVPLQGRFKVWLFQFVLLPRLLWPLTIYEIGLPTVEGLEKKVNRFIRSWLGLPPGMSSVALYSKSAKLRLPLRSIVEEYKVSKIWTQWMLNNSADIRIREFKPLLRTKRKFKAQDELNKSVSELTFEEMRGPIQTGRHAVANVGWNHFAKWSESCSAIRAELIIRERRREMESERVTKAVQQSQQGKWTTWEDVVQRSISWNEIWKMSPYRLAFEIRSIYDQLITF